MYLVKFTDPEWKKAAVSGQSIRIGSVLHYREIKDPIFRDEDEGYGEIVYQSKTPLDGKTHNRLFIDEGFRLSDEWKIDTGGCKIFSSKSIFNPFIFSCSLVQKKSEVPKLAKIFGKTSWYFIGDVWKFVNAVSEGLEHQIREVVMPNPDFRVTEDVKQKMHRLEILPLIGPIKYTNESKERIVNDSNVDSFDPRNLRFEPFFKKQTRFQKEKEFRMIWIINLGSIDKGEFDLSCVDLRTVDLNLENHGLRSKIKKIREIRNKRGKLVV